MAIAIQDPCLTYHDHDHDFQHDLSTFYIGYRCDTSPLKLLLITSLPLLITIISWTHSSQSLISIQISTLGESHHPESDKDFAAVAANDDDGNGNSESEHGEAGSEYD
jgi:hypothetical protein